MTEKRIPYEVEDSTESAMEMLGKGYRPVVQFEPPSEQIVETQDGGYQIAQSLGWVKLSAYFREKMLAKLKGAKLSVFICICLHVNEKGEAFPSIETIARETDLHRDTVMDTIAELEEIPGLISVFRRTGKKSIYRPAFAARGKLNEPLIPVDVLSTGGKKHKTSRQPVDVLSTAPVDVSSTIRREEEEEKREREEPTAFSEMTPKEAMKVPTLKLYRQAAEFFPGSLLWQYVHDTITKNNLTFEKINAAAIEWAARGYKKENVKGVLEWAVNGIPQNKNGNGSNGKTWTPIPEPEETQKRLRQKERAYVPRPETVSKPRIISDVAKGLKHG